MSDLAFAKQLMLNNHANTQKALVQHRHTADRGMLHFANTCKRRSIYNLFQHGLCISYDWLLKILT